MLLHKQHSWSLTKDSIFSQKKLRCSLVYQFNYYLFRSPFFFSNYLEVICSYMFFLCKIN